VSEGINKSVQSLGAFLLHDWLVEPSLNRLSREGTSIQLELRIMDVLLCLAERAGELVQRQELIDTVWSTEFISENTLTRAISELRSVFGDDSKKPSFIETIHRRGYRLIAPVRPATLDEPDQRRDADFPSSERRSASDDERSPYPGLAAFTEEDAEFFFGREADVARMWRKLTSRRLLGVIGPSGVGKSSFLQAGLIPAKPEGWRVVVCHPGDAPFAALARALVPEFAGDTEATAMLVDVSNGDRAYGLISKWRDRHDQALLIIDQFEELFTLSPPASHTPFTRLLRRLAHEADVHVLLSMRDDFLYHCHAHDSLGPIFAELWALDQPTVESLHKALLEPARRLGFSFEDDQLVTEMVAEVEGERGALPLLSFAIARLWENRDPDERLLTRQAYEDIGRVGGALARHAEATLIAIGGGKLPIARELFRNLVTAEGTRAVRELDELLSVFSEPHRDDAQDVLSTLIDARLLTSFEDEDTEDDGHRRVELVHESLLTSWPRLVRWRTQDADASQLREQLRQAARTWEKHDRTDDYLWIGKAYREFAVWRENYPGGLTKIEEEYAQAMTSHAVRLVRRRRFVLTAGVSVLLVVLAVVTALWQRSELAAHRAEAQKLVALGQLELEASPTDALAWGRASLELADTEQGRHLVFKAISRGPVARLLELDWETQGAALGVRFSPDGEWVALPGYDRLKVAHRSGGPVSFVDAFQTQGVTTIWPSFDQTGRRLAAWKPSVENTSGETHVYEVPGFSTLASIDEPLGENWVGERSTQRGLFFLNRIEDEIEIRMISFGGEEKIIGRIDRFDNAYIDPVGRWLIALRGRDVIRRSLEEPGAPDHRIFRLDREVGEITVDPGLKWLAAVEDSGRKVSAWRLGEIESAPYRSYDIRGMARPEVKVDDSGNRIAVAGRLDGAPTVLVWNLDSPERSEPTIIQNPHYVYFPDSTFDPSGRWLVTTHASVAAFWPMSANHPPAFDGDGRPSQVVGFTPDGKSVVTFGDDFVRLRRLADEGVELELPIGFPGWSGNVQMDPSGRFLLGARGISPVLLTPLDGSRPVELEAFEALGYLATIAYDAEQDLVATAPLGGPPEKMVIQVGKLGSGSVQSLGPADDGGSESVGGYNDLEFLPDGRLLSCSQAGVRRWSLETGSSELLYSGECGRVLAPSSGRTAVLMPLAGRSSLSPVRLDLSTGETRPLDGFPGNLAAATLSPRGDVFAAAAGDRSISVGLLSGGEPHLLFGHEAHVTRLAFSADGRWLASTDTIGGMRVWPVPDFSHPPFHTLPYDALMRKLYTLTNVRVVRDDSSPDGWKREIGPFPGWELVPEW
jgi:DNA-binding winged helix-turn-helix (wHTH) protein/WD40 repeat protein